MGLLAKVWKSWVDSAEERYRVEDAILNHDIKRNNLDKEAVYKSFVEYQRTGMNRRYAAMFALKDNK